VCLATGCGLVADLGGDYQAGEGGVDGSADGRSGMDGASDSAVADRAPVTPDAPGDDAGPDAADSASADATDTQPSDSDIGAPDALYPGDGRADADSGKTPPDGGCWANGQCFTVGGAVTGTLAPVILEDNGTQALSSAGQFTFPTALPDGASYKVTVAQQPMGSFCVVSSGSGKIVGSNVTNVIVNCANKVVFLTSTGFQGPLTGDGGVAAGDSICMGAAAANSFQLTGTFKAWLSDDTTGPAATFTHPMVPYVLLNGTTVASDWTGLISGSIAAPIDVTETGNVLSGLCVWTGTTVDGQSLPSDNCSGWTSAAPSNIGVSGNSGSNIPTWTDGCSATTCATSNRLYCFQQ
jgi:hypothetical protein